MRPIYLGAALAFTVVLVVGGVGLVTVVTGNEPSTARTVDAAAFRPVVVAPHATDGLTIDVHPQRDEPVPTAIPTPVPSPTAAPTARPKPAATPRPKPAVTRPTMRPKPAATPRPTVRPTPAPTPVHVPTVSDAKSYALSTLGSTQYSCIDAIFTRESGWNPYALAASGAYGIPQALPGVKLATAGWDWRTNPVTQVKWGIGYVHASYGSACNAWAFWQEHHWY